MRIVLLILLVLCASSIPRAGHAQLRDQLYTTPMIALPDDADAEADLHAPPPLVLVLPASAVAAMGPEGASDAALILGGVLGGGVGLVAGTFVGALLDGDADPDCIDFCFGPSLVIGLLAGEALGAAAGIHIANGRRGSLPLSMLTSAGILAVGLVAGNNHPEALIVVPLSQLYASIRVERRTARR